MNKDGSITVDVGSRNVLDDKLFRHLARVKVGSDLPKFTLSGKTFPCKCIQVYDGDTIHVAVKFHGVVNDFTIRMYGYNSAELRTKNNDEKVKGYAAKEYMTGLVMGKDLLVNFIDNDKYGNRWLGNIYQVDKVDGILYPGKCVNKLMISGGHGVEYYGKGEKKY